MLVGGVAQYAMGRDRARHREATHHESWGWVQIGTWNLGNGIVVTGTLLGEPLLVDSGSLLLILALAVALHAAQPRTGTAVGSSVPRLFPRVQAIYRALLIVLVISIPVGVVLSHLRHR